MMSLGLGRQCGRGRCIISVVRGEGGNGRGGGEEGKRERVRRGKEGREGDIPFCVRAVMSVRRL